MVDSCQDRCAELCIEGLEDAPIAREEVENLEATVLELQNRMYAASHRNEDRVIPPGNPIFHFVESNWFIGVGSGIIAANIVTMILELMHKHYQEDFYWLDQSFMVFYVVELSLKALCWKSELLIGKFHIVWWGWMDLVIVTTGVLDMWLQPFAVRFLDNGGPHNHDGKNHLAILRFARLTRMLRLCRLARLLKLIKLYLAYDLSWTEGHEFQVFIMSVIGFNSLLIGWECDHPHFFLWVYVEQVLLAIFLFEITARMRLGGSRFFFPETTSELIWNCLDTIIVVGGIMDQWLMPGIGIIKHLAGVKPDHSNKQASRILILLRLARLLRVLRLVRLIRGIPALYNLMTSVAQAMGGMIYVLLLMLVLLYLMAILGVQLISGGLVFGGTAPENVRGIFPNISTALFVLFNVVNGETGPLKPLFRALPSIQFVFMAFTVLSSWGILSILTAVVSENMMRTSAACQKENEECETRERAERSRVKLEEIFDSVDEDCTVSLTEDEFENLITDELKFEELRDATGLNKLDFKDLFKYLGSVDDCTGVPSISRAAFLDGLQNENCAVSERSIMRLEGRMAEVERILRQRHNKERAREEKLEKIKQCKAAGQTMFWNHM